KFLDHLLPEDLLPESSFYCVLDGDTLCGIGEHILKTSSVGVISQLFTLEGYRRRGIATRIAYALTESILSQNRIPVSFFTKSNISSMKVVERLGFALETRIGCLEYSSVV
ncbi:GNAT family N-acetyltransferase, partial [bacterium]|nr:GNAT family N-acetyltransferase [bacterium]